MNPLIARQLCDQGVDQTRIPDVVAILQGRAATLARTWVVTAATSSAGSEAGSGKPKLKRDALSNVIHALQEWLGTDLSRAA